MAQHAFGIVGCGMIAEFHTRAINEIDGSGEEVIRHLVTRLRERGLTMAFCGMKLQVMEVMRRTALSQLIGEENFFPTEEAALEAIFTRITDPDFDAANCPLRRKTGIT